MSADSAPRLARGCVWIFIGLLLAIALSRLTPWILALRKWVLDGMLSLFG